MMPKGTDIKAGAAFLRLAERDPGAQRFVALLEAARPKLIALGKILATLRDGSDKGLLAKSAALSRWAKRGAEAERRAWQEAFGGPLPQTIEDLVEWAARVEVPTDQILSGELKPGELLPIIQGHLLRQKDQQREQQQVPTAWSLPQSPADWAKEFQIDSPRTFIRWVNQGRIRAKRLSSKSYQVAIDDLPKPRHR